MARRVFLLGGAITPFIGKRHPDFVWEKHPDFGKRENPTLEETLQSAVLAAFEVAGVAPELVDRCVVGNFVGELFCNQGHLGAALVATHPALALKPSLRVEGACASGGLALATAVDGLRAGADVALVAGVEIQTTASARTGGDYLARAAHYRRQRGIDDFTFPALFARRVKACRETYGLSDEDLGHVSVKAYRHAAHNPLAHMKSVPMDLQTASSVGPRNAAFLQNPELQPYMKMSDCSQVSDGAAAALLVTEEGLRRVGRRPDDAIELTALAVAAGDLWRDGDPIRLTTSSAACARAYAEAGVGPGDIGVAEVHDCFTVTELLMMEAMGLCGIGRAAGMVREGRTALDGDIPINPGGGLVGFGHPVGATGVKQVIELWRQMRGLNRDYPLKRAAPWGMAVNMGGDDKTVVASIWRA
jgi:acetyl-CoA acyltransferase